MDRSLYIAASEGKVDVLRQPNDQLKIQTTANGNTALHVAAQFGQLQCVLEILEVCPSLLRRVNFRGETPLHMAAREGYTDIVKVLIERVENMEQAVESGLGGEAKKMLRATNVEKDTALHMAARNCHLKKDKYLEVVKLLARKDPEFQHPANNAKETPLYLAVERGSVDVVVMLLKTCTSPTYGGPGGRTALHAATRHRFTAGMLNALLEWNENLIKKPDAYGWTALHSAARCGNVEAVKKLLETDKSVAYAAAKGDEGNTALHIAAAVGDVSIMKELLSNCPDCWEMVNSKGKNVLHIAAYYKINWATNFILERPWVTYLINQKDDEGNTPLHLLASNRKDKELLDYPGADIYAVNYESCTPSEVKYSEDNTKAWPRQILNSNGRDTVRKDRESIINWKMSIKQTKREKEEREKAEREKEKQENEERGKKALEYFEKEADQVQKTAKTNMVVATLLATISFAASFTIPGGYSQQGEDEGRAVLVRDAAFKAFVITNTIAVICSTSSVFLYLSASLSTILHKDEEKVRRRYAVAIWLVIIGLFAMMLAFITGTYAVLAHSLGLAIPICVIACSAFMVYALELTKLCRTSQNQD